MGIVPLKGLNILVSQKYLDNLIHLILSCEYTQPAIRDEKNKREIETSILDKSQTLNIRKDIKDIINFLHFDTTQVDFSSRKSLSEADIKDIENKINNLKSEYLSLKSREEKAQKELEFYKKSIDKMNFFIKTNINLKDFSALRFLLIKYGKIPASNYQRVYNVIINEKIIIDEVMRIGGYSYIFLYYPVTESEKLTKILSDFNFEEVPISPDIKGSPKDLHEYYTDAMRTAQIELKKIELEKEELTIKNKKILSDSYVQLVANLQIREFQKACGGQGKYYVTSIWVPAKYENEFSQKSENCTDGTVIIKSFEPTDLSPEEKKKIPTIMSNNKWFSPFELIVEMYGKPSYFEVDPTPLLAISFVIMFGMMFGDIGQGFFLFALSRIFAKKIPSIKKAMAIISSISLSSIFFGCMYGECFGFHVFKGLWLSPMHDTMPFLLTTVVMGVIFMSIGVVINLYNSYKRKDLEEFLFSKNGLTGIWFYWGTLTFLFILGIKISFLFIVGIWIVPVVIMFFKEPLGALIRREKHLFHHGFSDFAVGSFFELLDTLIGFLSNTVSFVRVAAFALNHIGLFSVVILFTQMINLPRYDTVFDIFLIVVGNLFIIALEGFIVGIQVLRLEYYEIFSKFYGGSGSVFTPLKYKHE